jgi:hypothetical protein
MRRPFVDASTPGLVRGSTCFVRQEAFNFLLGVRPVIDIWTFLCYIITDWSVAEMHTRLSESRTVQVDLLPHGCPGALRPQAQAGERARGRSGPG